MADRTETTETGKPEAVFMMGGPAAGKSTIRDRNYPDHKVVDCDQWKERHPKYDPENPQVVHAWSREQCTKQFFRTLGGDDSFTYDGTGSNAERMAEWMSRAGEAGFRVVLHYVRCPLQVGLKRNRERERVVPEDVVREKYAAIKTSFTIARGYADEVRVTDNWNESELEEV